MRSKAWIFKSSILRQEKALAPLCAVAPQLRTAEPTANPRKMGLCWHLGSCVLAGARYATWCLCWRLLFRKTPKKPVFTACLAGTNPGTSGTFCGANPIICLFSANITPKYCKKEKFMSTRINYKIPVREGRIRTIKIDMRKHLKRFPSAMTVLEVAEALSCSKNTIYALIHDGSLKHVTHGRVIRIPKNALIDYLVAEKCFQIPSLKVSNNHWTYEKKCGIVGVANGRIES